MYGTNNYLLERSEQSHEQHDWLYSVLICIFLTIAWIAVSLRIYVRARLTKNLAWDDFWLVTTQTLATAGAIPIVLLDVNVARYGAGSMVLWHKYGAGFFASSALWPMASISLKISTALWFLSAIHTRRHRIAIISAVTVYSVCFLVFVTLLLFRCGVPNPIDVFRRCDCALNWNVLGPIYYTSAAFNGISDWIFAITAVSMIMSSQQMSRASRISAGLVVMLAVSGSVISILRIPFLTEWEFGSTFLAHQGAATMLAIIEIEIGAIAISLATMLPFIRNWRKTLGRHFPGLFPGLIDDADVIRARRVEEGSHGAPDYRPSPLEPVPRIGVLPSTFAMTRWDSTLARSDVSIATNDEPSNADPDRKSGVVVVVVTSEVIPITQ